MRMRGHLYHFRGKGKSRIDDRAELPEPAYQAMVAYLKAAGRLDTIAAEDAVFCAVVRYDPTRQLTGSYVWDVFKSYVRAAGLDERVTIHSLRHFAAQIRHEHGASVRDIQRLLRHSSIATTEIYLQALTATGDPMAAHLEQQFGKFSNGNGVQRLQQGQGPRQVGENDTR